MLETPTPGNREPSIKEGREEIKRPLSPVDPIVDPGKPVGPNDGPNLTDGPGPGAGTTAPPLP